MSDRASLHLRARHTRRLAIGCGSLFTAFLLVAGVTTWDLVVGRSNRSSWGNVVIGSFLGLATILVINCVRLLYAAMRWRCEKCSHVLSDALPWTCGLCGALNTQPSFLHQCRRCRKPPSAFRCPKCDTTTALIEGAATDHPAQVNARIIGFLLRGRWRRRRGFWFAMSVAAVLGGTLIGIWLVADLWRNGLHSRHQYYAALYFAGLWCCAFWAQRRCLSVVIRWHCHECGKRLESNEPWICGFCDRENRLRSFLHKCKHCKARPPGYLCHHCGTTTRFWLDADERHPARRLPHPRPGETPEQADIRNEREMAQRLNAPGRSGLDPAMEQELERTLHRLKVGMLAVTRSKTLQAQVEQEIISNSGGLPPEEVERLHQYAKRQFDGYREDIALGRFDQ